MSIFNFFKKKSFGDYYEDQSEREQEIQKVSEKRIAQTTQNKHHLQFVDSSELVFASLPIELAKNIPVSSKQKIENSGEKFTFPLCPGMFDYSRVGYIMRSWCDFHFKVNKAGSIAIAGGGKRKCSFSQPLPMESNIVDGLFKLSDGIALTPFNLNSPWKVFSYDNDISAFLLPAWFHSDPEFLDNFYLYPGVVDYNTFHTMNVILAPKKRCEYTVKAGDPILHIIPFYNKDIICGYGPPTIEQKSLSNYDPKVHENHFYRKNHMKKKTFKLEKEK